MNHPTPEDFVVGSPINNPRYEAMAEAIKNVEPAVRASGRAMNWDKFTSAFDSGSLQEGVPQDLDSVSEARIDDLSN